MHMMNRPPAGRAVSAPLSLNALPAEATAGLSRLVVATHWTALMIPTIAAASYLVVSYPTFIVSCIAAVGMLRFPTAALSLAVSTQALRQPLLDSGLTGTQINSIQFGALTLGAIGSAWYLRRVGRLTAAAWAPVALTLVVLTPFIMSARLGQTGQSMAIAIYFAAVPSLAYLIGRAAPQRAVFAFALLGVLLTAINVAESARQIQQGVDSLVQNGYDYGTTVRQIDGHLRAFGFMATNSDLGLMVAALALLVAAARAAGRPLPFLIEVAILAASATGIYWSTSRSGFILIALFLAFAMGAYRRRTLGTRVIVTAVFAIGIALVIYAYAGIGATSDESLFDRFRVWGTLIREYSSPLGNGPGSVGAASYSSLGTSKSIFVDNSWLSIYLQYGIVGLTFAVVSVVVALRYTLGLVRERATRDAGLVAMGGIVSLAVVSFFVELIDYPMSTAVIGFTIGVALRTISPVKPDRTQAVNQIDRRTQPPSMIPPTDPNESRSEAPRPT